VVIWARPHMLLRRAAIRDNRLKPTTIHWSDVDDNSCSQELELLRAIRKRPLNQTTSLAPRQTDNAVKRLRNRGLCAPIKPSKILESMASLAVHTFPENFIPASLPRFCQSITGHDPIRGIRMAVGRCSLSCVDRSLHRIHISPNIL